MWPFIVDALVEPLTWLTVAALVYGAFAQDTRAVVRGTRLDTVADRMDRTHALTRTTVTRSTTGFQERWIPPANAFRLVTRGGAALFGMFCLCYVVIHVGTEYADRAARALVGNDSPSSGSCSAAPGLRAGTARGDADGVPAGGHLRHRRHPEPGGGPSPRRVRRRALSA
nr:hypothetical protein GCM10020093_085670 [Planobispora longispora]